MARPIASTPKLDAKAAKIFLHKVEEGLKKPTGPVPTPRIDSAIDKVIQYDRDRQDRNQER